MIARLWQGRCVPHDADAYEALLLTEILPELDRAPGCFGAFVLRREDGPTAQYLVMHLFDSLDAVRSFAGERYEDAVVPEGAQRLLSSYDTRVQYFEVIGKASV